MWKIESINFITRIIATMYTVGYQWKWDAPTWITLEVKDTALAVVSLAVQYAQGRTLWLSIICHAYCTALYFVTLFMARHNAITLVVFQDILPWYTVVPFQPTGEFMRGKYWLIQSLYHWCFQSSMIHLKSLYIVIQMTNSIRIISLGYYISVIN